MRIHVADLPADGLTVQEHLDSRLLKKDLTLDDKAGCAFRRPLTVRVQVMPRAGMIEVHGRLAGEARLACVRCLEAADVSLNSQFRLTFTREIPGQAAEDPPENRELRAEEMGLVLYEGDDIDLHDAIHEQVVMAMPMQPLCRPDCRGLCARCGANLNTASCRCVNDEVDPRLAVLKSLKLDS